MKRFLILAASSILFLAGCQGNSDTSSSNGKTAANSNKSNDNAAVKSDTLKVADVIKAFQAANLPLNQLQFFNAASDPDKLLGTPNHYTGKATWQTTDKMPHLIEEFAGDADLQSTKIQMESGMTADKKDFIYTHKNILVRLNYQMVPETAAKFDQALKSL